MYTSLVNGLKDIGCQCMAAEDAWVTHNRGVLPARPFGLDGPALRVETGGPRHALHVFLARDELPGDAVQHIEETVFRRMQEDLAIFAANAQVRQDDILSSGEIPGFPRCFLKIPDHLAGFRLDGDDRTQEQVVAAP